MSSIPQPTINDKLAPFGAIVDNSLSTKFNKIIETIDTEEGDPRLLVYLDTLAIYINSKIEGIVLESPDYETITN